MAADAAQVASAKELLSRQECLPLAERLAGLLPGGGMSWLDEHDPVLSQCMCPDSEGGWLSSGEDSELWNLVREAAETGSASQFATWLDNLVGHWEAAAAAWHSQAAAPAIIDDAVVPRFDEAYTAPVDGYPGWWQGYDQIDGVWKFAKSSQRPDGSSPGWTTDSTVMWKEAVDLMDEDDDDEADGIAELTEKLNTIAAMIRSWR